MKFVNIIFYGIAIILVIVGFLSWRFEFTLPLYEFWYYIIGGIALTFLTTFGRVLAPFIMFLSILPFIYSLILLVFFKSSTWSEMSTPVYIGFGLLSFGLVLYAIGSESVLKSVEADERHAARDIFCDACDQYLGKAQSFRTPCPRCGSNRYKYND